MKFIIKDRKIKYDKDFLIGDNSDYIAQFEFDEEWSGVTKTARFIACNGDYADVLLEDDQCCIPCEVLKCGYIGVGVYSSEKTTTECQVYINESIKEREGNVCEPTPDVYEQLTGKLDNIQEQMPVEVETQVTDYFEAHKDDFKGEKGEKGEAGAIKFVVVAELPTENIDESAIYLVPTSDPESQNNYDEYIYANDKWEFLGSASVKVDLDGYATIEQLDTLNTTINGMKPKTDKLFNDTAWGGMAVGLNATTSNGGGACGYNSLSQGGFAGGQGAAAVKGAALGYMAKANYSNNIQLGTGTNNIDKTLQVLDKNIYNAETDTLKVANITDGTTTKSVTEILAGGGGSGGGGGSTPVVESDIEINLPFFNSSQSLEKDSTNAGNWSWGLGYYKRFTDTTRANNSTFYALLDKIFASNIENNHIYGLDGYVSSSVGLGSGTFQKTLYGGGWSGFMLDFTLESHSGMVVKVKVFSYSNDVSSNVDSITVAATESYIDGEFTLKLLRK